MSENNTIDRRRFLEGAAAAGILGSGCLGGNNGSNSGNGGGTGSGSGSQGSGGTPEGQSPTEDNGSTNTGQTVGEEVYRTFFDLMVSSKALNSVDGDVARPGHVHIINNLESIREKDPEVAEQQTYEEVDLAFEVPNISASMGAYLTNNPYEAVKDFDENHVDQWLSERGYSQAGQRDGFEIHRPEGDGKIYMLDRDRGLGIAAWNEVAFEAILQDQYNDEFTQSRDALMPHGIGKDRTTFKPPPQDVPEDTPAGRELNTEENNFIAFLEGHAISEVGDFYEATPVGYTENGEVIEGDIIELPMESW